MILHAFMYQSPGIYSDVEKGAVCELRRPAIIPKVLLVHLSTKMLYMLISLKGLSENWFETITRVVL